jgi:hypothetical protein
MMVSRKLHAPVSLFQRESFCCPWDRGWVGPVAGVTEVAKKFLPPQEIEP